MNNSWFSSTLWHCEACLWKEVIVFLVCADDKKRFLNFRVNIVYKTIKNEGNIEDTVEEFVGYICKMMGMNKPCPKKKK